jgi:enediyne biosynthesis protein E4
MAYSLVLDRLGRGGMVMFRHRGRQAVVLSLTVLVGGVVYGGWKLCRTWWYLTALTESRRQVHAAKYAVASRNLTALLAREPESDEAAYLLGFCARALGRTAMAFEAWERVRPGTPAAAQATLGLATLLVDQGRLADAETLINKVLADPRMDGLNLRRFLGTLFWYEGRRDEALRLMEASWNQLRRAGRGSSEQAIELARLHNTLIDGTSSTESIRTIVDRADKLAPNDDRLWLAKANLAIQQGEFIEAGRWLDACQDHRPDDTAVWCSRLTWAMKTRRVSAARNALRHLPIGESTAQVYRLAAWFAAQHADQDAEERALRSLLLIDPDDNPAIDRLTELAVISGKPEQVTELRHRKSEVDQLQLQYQQLLLRDQPVRDAAALAHLAERLGRRFEAKAFLTVAVSWSPARADLRDALARMMHEDRNTISVKPGSTLAEALANEIDSTASVRID